MSIRIVDSPNTQFFSIKQLDFGFGCFVSATFIELKFLMRCFAFTVRNKGRKEIPFIFN